MNQSTSERTSDVEPPPEATERQPVIAARERGRERSRLLDTSGWAWVGVIAGLAMLVAALLPSLAAGQPLILGGLNVGESEVLLVFAMVVICLSLTVLAQSMTDDLTDRDLE